MLRRKVDPGYFVHDFAALNDRLSSLFARVQQSHDQLNKRMNDWGKPIVLPPARVVDPDNILVNERALMANPDAPLPAALEHAARELLAWMDADPEDRDPRANPISDLRKALAAINRWRSGEQP